MSRCRLSLFMYDMFLIYNMHVCIQGAEVELQSVSWACMAECAPVAAPVHGSVLGGGGIKHQGDTVSISCDSGYAMVCADGTRSEECNALSCQSDGKGNGVYDPEGEVTCVAKCPAYPAVKNGEVSPLDNVLVGDTVDITCAMGYTLAAAGKSRVNCVPAPNGKGAVYDSMGVMCIAACDPYPAVTNGEVDVLGATVEGDHVTITCHTGYEPLFSTATCIDGGADVGGNNSVKCSLMEGLYPQYTGALTFQISTAGVYDKRAGECKATISQQSSLVLCSPLYSSVFLCIPTLHGKYTGALTFQNLLQAKCGAYPAIAHAQISPPGPVFAGGTNSEKSHL